MSSTGWQVCALRIVARVPRPAALVCHALRRGARHHVGYAALRCFAGDAGSTRFRSEPGVIRPSGVQIRCVPDSYADSRGCTSIIFDPPKHLLCTNRCQASELSAHTFYYRGVDFRRSQQALGAAARRFHCRGKRGVQAGEAAGEARRRRPGDESGDHQAHRTLGHDASTAFALCSRRRRDSQVVLAWLSFHVALIIPTGCQLIKGTAMSLRHAPVVAHPTPTQGNRLELVLRAGSRAFDSRQVALKPNRSIPCPISRHANLPSTASQSNVVLSVLGPQKPKPVASTASIDSLTDQF